MKLDDAKEHLQELLRVCQGKADLDMDYLRKVVQFCEEFKTWTPEIYLMVDGGVVQGASANCSMHFNLWDNDNEVASQMMPNDPIYEERLSDWEDTIKEGHESGKLKPIF